MSIRARFLIRKTQFDLDVDLDLASDGITAIFGPSGSGKTTLLRAIAGLDAHLDAILTIGDEVWQEGSQFVPPHRRRIGFVFQETSLFSHLDVQRNLEYGMRRVPESERRIELDQAVDLLGIRSLLDRRPDQLSGGERQRVAIARALAVSPRLLLMDEPLASLDEARKTEILPYLESLNREFDIPILYVSHAFDEVARLADHVVILEAGRVVAAGPTGEIITRLDLPLAHSANAEAIVPAVVAAIDTPYQLTHLDFPGGRITVSGTGLRVGAEVRIRIAARDVSLTLEPQTRTSILNIIEAVIDEISPRDDARMTIRLLANGIPLLARITRKSVDSLDLTPGKHVFAQVKSVAILA